MPTLVNDLSHSQQMWLFDTFGPSTDAEDQFMPVHHSSRNEDPVVLGGAGDYGESATERRVSDATSVHGSDHVSSPSPEDHGQFSPHPVARNNSSMEHYYLPHAPDLQHHQPAPSGHHDNRSTIFRRSAGGGGGIENEFSELSPRPWPSTDRSEQGLYNCYMSHHQPPPPLHHSSHQHHHHHLQNTPPNHYQQHHPSAAFDTISPSRSFNMLRPPRASSNSRASLLGGAEAEKLQAKRMSGPLETGGSATGQQPAPFYPHKGEKLTWQQSFENLQVYKQTYGDCDVPQKYKHNVKLGGWVVRIFQQWECQIKLENSSLTSCFLYISRTSKGKRKRIPQSTGN